VSLKTPGDEGYTDAHPAERTAMKIAISGKGGVGKTTLSAMLASALSLKGGRVIALDADPDANLASALGVPIDQQPVPLAEMKDLIAERTGSESSYGGYFKLNPKVDDLPEKHAAKIDSIRVLALGGVRKGGGGCICPASALVKALLTHLILGRDESVIMDMEAGIEHLGRATGQSMDAMIIVVDEGAWSLQTAGRIRTLAGDIGVTRLFAVANRVAEPEALEALGERLEGLPLIGHLPYERRLAGGIARVGDDGRLLPTDAMTDCLPLVEDILRQLQSRL